MKQAAARGTPRLKTVLGTALATLLIAVITWSVMSWPLPRHARYGIAAAHRAEDGGPRYMIAGDHLQLKHHFWLLADSLWGDTAFFTNPYEFNTGGEDPPVHGLYYAPFGALFALFYPVTGRALAWNTTSLLAFWIGFLCTVLLLRRNLQHRVAAWLAAIALLVLPYQWTAFMGGSPTGFAMMWPPVIFLGLDLAIRDRRSSGAWLAAAGLVLVHWGDLHTFFFSFLAAPCWAAWLLWRHATEACGETLRWRPLVREGFRRALRLWPLGIGMALAYLKTRYTDQTLEDTLHAAGRSMREILIFSPTHRGWWGWNVLGGHDSQIYLGIVLSLTLAAGLGVMTWDVLCRRPRAGRRWIGYAVLLAGVMAVALLALGPRIPGDRHAFVLRALHRLIPPYRMIRQTAKIYSVLPPMLALVFGLALDQILDRIRCDRGRILAAVLIVLLAVGDYARRIQPTICLLDKRQEAYAALAAEARAEDRLPRAVAIPLWPGDTHWSSLYQYYASLHGVRMINGYSPVMSRQYFDEVFLRFSPLNGGYAGDELLDALLAMGIDFLVLHEDAFPEKVSPFPVVQTLAAFRQHPRLRLLQRDRAVWAFRILPLPRATAGAEEVPRYLFPTRFWEGEHFRPEGAEVHAEPGNTSRDHYLRLPPGSPRAVFPQQPVRYLPGLRYAARVRGGGAAEGQVYAGNEAQAPQAIPLEEDWTWVEIPVAAYEGFPPLRLETGPGADPLEVDLILMAAGGPHAPQAPGDSVRWPADAFVRSGYSDPDTGTVMFEADRVLAAEVFYGPMHSLPPGIYELELEFTSPAPHGTKLGEISLRSPPRPDDPRTPVLAGEPCRWRYVHDGTLLFSIQLRYLRAGDMRLEALTVRRLE